MYINRNIRGDLIGGKMHRVGTCRHAHVTRRARQMTATQVLTDNKPRTPNSRA